MFLLHLLTELDNPQHLDLSNNKFGDQSVAAFAKYIFANEECRLLHVNLEDNAFSSFGKRTLLKAYSLCAHRQQLQFKLGPLPLTEATLKLAFNAQTEQKKAKDGSVQTQVKSLNQRDKLELRIVRRPNFPGVLRSLPVTRQDRETL